MGADRSGRTRSRPVRVAAVRSRAVRPRWTVRLRLTLVYGGLFLVSGVALLAITNVLVQHEIDDSPVAITQTGVASASGHAPGSVAVGFVRVPANAAIFRAQQVSGMTIGGGKTVPVHSPSPGISIQVAVPGVAPGKTVTARQALEQVSILVSEAHGQQDVDLHQLLLDSGIALLIMAVLSVLLGWLVAGRALRPLRVITSKAQDISSTNLHERISLHGPDDEMKRLGDTFDDLLARLERAFVAQRQFVANASHELRTPLARQRTLLEVAAEDPDADVISLREASLKAISAGEEQEQLIEALLTLASSERGLDQRSPFDLADTTRRVLGAKQSEAALRGLDVQATLASSPTTGNRRLAERLVSNLVENALRYNEPRGWIVVTTGLERGRAVLRIANSGPVVPESEIDRIFEPFERLASDRISREGHGLGLSIVRAVAAAHGATVRVESRPTGGLDVRVNFALEVAGEERDPGERRGPGGGGPDEAGSGAPAWSRVPTLRGRLTKALSLRETGRR